MTFSDSKVVDFINQNFIPVWETASAARWVKFELGEGRSVEGIATGEIALYFCDAKGHVYDILPALQSPAQTLEAMKAASKFYQEAKGEFDNQSIREFHEARMREIAGKKLTTESYKFPIQPAIQSSSNLQKSEEGIKTREERINESIDAATKDLRFLAFSKSAMFIPDGSSLIVVEPGGRDYYRWEVARRFCEIGTWQTKINSATMQDYGKSEPNFVATRTPNDWKDELFPFILQQPLDRGGEYTYDSSSLEAIRIIPK